MMMTMEDGGQKKDSLESDGVLPIMIPKLLPSMTDDGYHDRGWRTDEAFT